MSQLPHNCYAGACAGEGVCMQNTAWCSEIGSLWSLDASEVHASVTSKNQFNCTKLCTADYGRPCLYYPGQQKSHLTTHARRFYGNVSKKNGDGRRSYERFEREEDRRRTPSLVDILSCSSKKNYPRGFGSQYLVHKIWSLDANDYLECLLTSRSSKRGGRSPTNSMTN